MGVARAQLDSRETLEAERVSRSRIRSAGLVAERLAQRHPEQVRHLLLCPVPEPFQPVRGVDLLDQEDAARREPVVGLAEEAVPGVRAGCGRGRRRR